MEKIHITSIQAIKSNEAESAAVFCHPAGSGISVGRGQVVGKNGLIVPNHASGYCQMVIHLDTPSEACILMNVPATFEQFMEHVCDLVLTQH